MLAAICLHVSVSPHTALFLEALYCCLWGLGVFGLRKRQTELHMKALWPENRLLVSNSDYVFALIGWDDGDFHIAVHSLIHLILFTGNCKMNILTCLPIHPSYPADRYQISLCQDKGRRMNVDRWMTRSKVRITIRETVAIVRTWGLLFTPAQGNRRKRKSCRETNWVTKGQINIFAVMMVWYELHVKGQNRNPVWLVNTMWLYIVF